MKSFEIKITGNAKSLVDSIKSSQSAMDALIKGIDKADKKLEVLTQTGSHLSDIDKQLAKLKTDYPDIFEKIFPNIDSQINESMKPILQMPELVEQTMTKVVQKMKSIDNGVLKVTDDDIKELGNDMRLLGETLHLENLDMSFLDGTAKAETKIKRLIDTMGRLVEAYYNVNMATTNVDVENVAQKKNGSKKSKGNIKTSPVDDEENMKKELSELEKYQQILKVINGEDIKLKTTKKDDLEQLKLLVAQFDEATNAIKRFEAARDTNSDEYKEALAEQYRLAVLLKNTMDDVADNGSEKAVNFISSQTGKFGAYSQAEELIKTGFGPNLTNDIGEIFTKKIEKASFSYDRLTESVERFYEIFQKVNNDDNLTDEETDALYEEAEKIKNTFASLDIRTKDFFENLSLGVINTKEAIQELTKMFGIELPAAMDKPEEKIQKLLPTSEGLEKLRIIPDGDQKARISEYAEEYRVILKLLQQGNIESKETISALRERARTLKNIIQGVNPGDTTLDKLLTDGYGISKGTANTVASTKLASKFKIDEFKSENISNDAREKAINLIHQEIIAENKLAKKIEEERSAIDGKNSALKKSSQLIEKILLDESKSEKFLYVNTDKGTSSDIAIGTEHGLTKDKRESLLEPFGGPSQFNATLHTHPEKIAAPSGKNGDLDIFLNDFDKFKKNFILAGEQLAEIDFSSLTKEQVEKIKDAFILKESDIDPMDFDNLLMKDIATLSPEISTELSKWMKMNLSSLIPDKTKENIGDEQIINDAIETYIENVCAFIKNGNIGDLSHEDFMLEMDRVATETLSTYSDNVKKGLRSIFAGNASDAFDEISGAKQSLQDELQQALQNAFIQSIKEVGLDASKIFKLYDAKNFDFETFKPKATSTQEPATKPTESNSGNIQADADAHKENTDAINTENNAIDSNTKAMQENSDAANANAEALKKRNEENKQTEQIASDSLDAFRALQNEILGKSAVAEGGSMDGEAIGRYTERVETAKAKLDELAKQSLLTADQIKEANDIYETAIGNLEGKSRTNKEYYDNLAENTGREPAGSYDDGYDRGYYDARSDADSELDNLQKQLNEAEAELNRAKASMDSGTPIDISTELQSLENIRTKLEEVKNAIIAKNKAFNDEGIIVGQVVGKEIRTLDLLLNKINDITNAINTKTESFQTEGNVVSKSVKQATKIKEETKKKDTFDTDKENLISVVSEYEKSLSDVQFIPDDALNKVSEMQAKLKDITNSNDLAKWKSEWDLLTESIESARKEQEELIFEKQKNQLTGIKNTLSNSYKSAKIDATNVPEELQEVKTGYEDIVARINTCIKQRKILTEEEVAGFAREAATIKQVLDVYTEKTKVQTKNSSAYGSAFVKNATNKYDRLYSIATNDEFGVSPAVVTKAQELKSVYEQIVSLNKSFANTNPSEEQRIAFNRLTDEFNETYSALDKIIKSSRKLAQNGSNIFELYNDGKTEFDLSSEEGRMTALKEAVNFMSDGKAQIGEFNRECTALNYTVKNSDGTFTEFTARINEAGTAIVETTGKTQKSTTMFGRFFDELKRKARGIATYLISITSFQSVWQEIRQGITYIKEIDSALTELKKVTDETDETYEKFLDTASKVGSEIGSTIADFTDATADFARLGYSISEATKLAEAASIYKNVGDGIDSVSQATESIISTMKAFGIEADNSMAIVDKFNEVGNNFAISSTGIGEALQRSASALYESGNTLDESIGLITAANSVIQNPEQVGTALKTLSLRLRGAKVELEEAGEDVDGMADSVSSLQAKLLALTHGKVDIMADASTFKNTTQILREMSKAWEDMTDIERSAALELMGGKRQANILASIIKNYDTVDSVIESSINSQNSAYEENIKWMDSIEGKMTKFNNAVQSLWKDTLGSNAIKDVVDLGTGLVKILDTIGVIPSILGGIAIYFTAIKKNNPITMFKDLMNTIQNFSTAVTNVQTLSKAGVVFDSNSVSTYAAAVSDLSAKQQALALSSAGLTKQQVAEVLAKNGCSEATIEQAVAEASLTTAKATTNTITGEQLFNLAAEKDIKLSEQAVTWLAANAEKELTRQKILAAVASGDLTKAEAAALLATSGLTGGVKGLGAALKALFLNNPIGLALMAVTAITGVVSAVKGAKREIEQAVRETLNTYKDAQNTLRSNKSTIDEISSDYERLSKGVDDFGNNISLTTDEYKKYNEITNKIADMFPEMISGYTKEGNAILSCKGNVEELTKAYEAAAQAARQAAIAGGGEVFKSAKEEYNSNPSIAWEDTGLKQQQKLANKIIEIVNNENEEELEKFIGDLSVGNVEIDGEKYSNIELKSLFESAGIHWNWNNVVDVDDIKNGLKNLQSFVKSSVSGINAETLKVKSILSAYLGEDEDYSKLDDETRSIIDNIVSKLDDEFVFSFDNVTSLYSYISENIVKAFSNSDGKIKDAIDSFLKINTSNLSVNDYKKEIDNFKQVLSDSEISEEVQQQILAGFGIDDDSIKEEIDPLVNHAKEILSDEFKDLANTLTLSELKIIDNDAFEVPEGTTLTWDELKEKIREVRNEIQTQAAIDTYSSYEESATKIIDAMSIVNEAIIDRTQLTQEQGEALKGLIGNEEGYADAIDDTNGYVVKNAALLRKLIAAKRDDQQATIRMAKAMAQLQYRNTVKQLQQLLSSMQKKYKGTILVSNATLKNVSVLRDQINALKQTIKEYSLLELEMSELTNAYRNFEKAKEIDSQLTYGDSMIEMLEAINEGFKTGQVGTETFNAAVEALVPESVYANIDNFKDRMVAIHDYIDKNPLFADWFTIDDGEFKVTQDNIEAFVKDLQDLNLFTQSDENGNFFLTEGTTLDTIVEKTGATKAAIVSMITEFSKYDASWSDILSDLTTTPLDKEINKATAALDSALAAQEAYIRSGKELSGTEWETICQNVDNATTSLNNATDAAQKNAEKSNQLEAVYASTMGTLKLTQQEADALAKSLGLIDENGQPTLIVDDNGSIQLTTEQAKKLNEEMGKITSEPSIMDIQLRYDTIVPQIEALKRYIKGEVEDGDKDLLLPIGINVEDADEETKAKAQELIDKLTPEQNTIEVKYGITETSEEQQKGAIEKLEDWEANGMHFTAYAAMDEESKNKVQEEKDKLGEDENPTIYPSVDPTSNIIAENTLNDTARDRHSTIYVETVETGNNSTNNSGGGYSTVRHFDGTANASGNWGLPQAEHNSLVGELGTETVVDPHTGRYYTVGDHGAELVDLPKDAIIFNHLQTKELFKNGHINSRGKLTGGAYAEGNAHYGLFTGYTDYSEVFKNGSDNWVSAWDETLRDLSDSADSISGAGDDISGAADKFEETFDWFAVLLEEIENSISLMNAQLENAVGIGSKKNVYYQILDTEYFKVKELNEGIKLYTDYSAKLLAKIPDQYKEMAKNGAVAITDFVGEANQEVVEAINNYREWESKVKDLNQQLEETKKQISETRVQIQEMVKTEYTNEIGLTTVKNDQIQSAIDLLEEQGERASDVFYKAMTENSNTQLKKLQEQREKMQEELDKAVKSGDVKKFSEDWYSMVNAIYEVDASIIDCETDIEGFQNAINDLHWENFDKIITAIDNVSDEAEQLRGLIDDDDIADDVGNWTSDGITSLGLLAQEMEKAKYRAELYGEQVKQLNKDYAAGKYSTDEYNEKLKELKDSQYDSIDAMKSAKKSIIDVNKTRIEAVKNGIQKEIDAYEKLISKRKEDLSSQKDAHDWAKTLKEHNDEIDKIQRQIDAMSGDNSAAATAKRKKLEAELAEAQSSLNEDLYSHDIETQQNALDKELDAYKENQDKKMEELDNYLKNEEQVLADSLKLILENADGIDAFLKNISEEYGVSIYDAVVDPWSDGADALARYLEMLKELRGEQEGIQKEADSNANDTVNNINKSTTDTTSAEYVEPPKPEPKPSRPSSGGGYYAPSSVGVGSAVTVKSNATNFSRDGGNGTKMQGWVPGSTFTVMETSGDQVLIGIPGSGYTGWVNKNDLVGFAKGTKGVKSSQLAMIDENGLEELVLHADGNGKLAFLSKGTSVIPADITENLMKLGSIDPTEMLKRNTPSIGAPHIINNTMELNINVGEIIHAEHIDKDSLPDIQNAIQKQLDNYMKQVNNSIKRYSR